MAGTDSLKDIGLPPSCNATNPQRVSLNDWTTVYETFFKKEGIPQFMNKIYNKIKFTITKLLNIS